MQHFSTPQKTPYERPRTENLPFDKLCLVPTATQLTAKQESIILALPLLLPRFIHLFLVPPFAIKYFSSQQKQHVLSLTEIHVIIQVREIHKLERGNKGTAYFLGFTAALNEVGPRNSPLFLVAFYESYALLPVSYTLPSWTDQCCKHRKCDFMPCELLWNSSISLTPPFLPHPPKSVQWKVHMSQIAECQWLQGG